MKKNYVKPQSEVVTIDIESPFAKSPDPIPVVNEGGDPENSDAKAWIGWDYGEMEDDNGDKLSITW